MLEESCWKKGDFFQLISSLFCVVKRGFVQQCKMLLPCLGWRSANVLQGFFCPKCLQDQRKHTRSSTKIYTYDLYGRKS
jgi:hypothetical protein